MVTLTTVDNPFDPIAQFYDWYECWYYYQCTTRIERRMTW